MSSIKNHSVVNKFMFMPPRPSYGHSNHVFYIPLNDDIEISCFLLGHYNNALIVGKDFKEIPSRPVIIVCHGNATDTGQLIEQMFRLCNLTRCHILLMEYPGYGLSTKVKTTEENCKLAVEKTVDFVINTLKVSANNIIFYGRSIGSGVATYGMKYCCQKYKSPAGLILISPYLSIKKLAKEMTNVVPIMDRFVTEENIKFCTKTHVLIIHGKRDEVIPISHGKELGKIASEYSQFDVHKLFPEDATHNNFSQRQHVNEPIVNFVSIMNFDVDPYHEHALTDIRWDKQTDDIISNPCMDLTLCSLATSAEATYASSSSLLSNCCIL